MGVLVDREEFVKGRVLSLLRQVPDFPKKGILFQDVMPVIADYQVLRDLTQFFAERYRGAGLTAVLGLESRGFIFGVLLAQELQIAFVPVRKPGKLPGKTFQASYMKEYGEDQLEIQQDSIGVKDRVLVVDDLLATGGTLEAASSLVKQTGAELYESLCLLELKELKGRDKFKEALYTLLQL